MTDFTPGPLEARTPPNVPNVAAVYEVKWEPPIAMFYGRRRDANARLFAGGADMYAALKGIVDNGIWNDEWDAVDVARAVLAKVDGA